MKSYGAELVIEDVSADEPPEEGSFDELSYEIITEEEIARLCSLTASMSSASSGTSMTSSSSLGSAGNGPSIRGHSSSAQRNPHNQPVDSSSSSKRKILLTEEELTASARIWYRIQLQGHNYFEDAAATVNKLGTMEDSSTKRTNWLLNLLHLHERMKQAAADKRRFNVNAIPQKTREQLKHIYVY